MSDRHVVLRRVLTMIALLAIEAWTTVDLAHVLGVHRRTIARDLSALRGIGLPLIKERPAWATRRGVRLRPGWRSAWLRSNGIDPQVLRHRRAARAYARRTKGDPIRVGKGHSISRRELHVIGAVACPVCKAPVGSRCQPLSVGDQAMMIRRLVVHRARRVAWHMLRSGEMADSKE